MSLVHNPWIYQRPHRRRPPIAAALFILAVRACRRANAGGNVIQLDQRRKGGDPPCTPQ